MATAKKNPKLASNFYKSAKPMSPITKKNETPAPNSKFGDPKGNKMPSPAKLKKGKTK